jgi:uncharacterized protein with PIN domain
MDLWAEYRILDFGERLGRYISRYRLQYFRPDKYNGPVVYSYKPLPGAEEQIYNKISDITISMKSTDYLKMPAKIMNEVRVKLDEKEQKLYDTMKKGTDDFFKGQGNRCRKCRCSLRKADPDG